MPNRFYVAPVGTTATEFLEMLQEQTYTQQDHLLDRLTARLNGLDPGEPYYTDLPA